MGRIVNSTFVSLDGVINHMDRWHFGYVDDESNDIAVRQLHDSDAMLMGRRTYEVYAGAWPGRDGEYADLINRIPKFVASTTLTTPSWTNTSVLAGELIPAVADLKQNTERDILMHGYGPVARTLLRHGLLDELHLWVHPVLAGVGTSEDHLLTDGLAATLQLDDVTRLGSGVVMLSYRAG